MSNVTKSLNVLLADMVVFRQKVLHYHWSVKGHNFFQLHEQFEEYYNQWSGWIDEVAERVLQLDDKPLPTLQEMIEHSTLTEDPSNPTDAEMVQNLANDMEAQAKDLNELIEQAEEAKDRPTANLADDVNDEIAKHRWMLNAWLDQKVPQVTG